MDHKTEAPRRGRPPKGPFTEKTRQITTRIRESTYDRINEKAGELGMSMSQVVEKMICMGLEITKPSMEEMFAEILQNVREMNERQRRWEEAAGMKPKSLAKERWEEELAEAAGMRAGR